MNFNFYSNIIEGKIPVNSEFKKQLLKTDNEIGDWIDSTMAGVNWKINNNKTVTIEANAFAKIEKYNKRYLPIKMSVFKGELEFNDCKLISLEGCPDTVKGDFKCENMGELLSLEHIPKKITESLDIVNCPKIKSFEGIGECKYFYYDNLKGIETLKGFPVKHLSFSKILEDFPHLSWLPIIDKLDDDFISDTQIGLFSGKINKQIALVLFDCLDFYYTALKTKKIDDKILSLVYEVSETKGNAGKFCRTILKDLEELELY